MGEGLLSTFDGQVSGRWSVHLLRFLIIANTRGLWGGWGFGGTPLPWHAQGYLEVTTEIERGIFMGINKLKPINVG